MSRYIVLATNEEVYGSKFHHEYRQIVMIQCDTASGRNDFELDKVRSAPLSAETAASIRYLSLRSVPRVKNLFYLTRNIEILHLLYIGNHHMIEYLPSISRPLLRTGLKLKNLELALNNSKEGELGRNCGEFLLIPTLTDVSLFNDTRNPTVAGFADNSKGVDQYHMSRIFQGLKKRGSLAKNLKNLSLIFRKHEPTSGEGKFCRLHWLLSQAMELTSNRFSGYIGKEGVHYLHLLLAQVCFKVPSFELSLMGYSSKRNPRYSKIQVLARRGATCSLDLC